MSHARWYVKCGDGERGPFSAEQLQRMAESGEIRPKTLVRKGSPKTPQLARRSFGWEEAGLFDFLTGYLQEAAEEDVEGTGRDAAQRRDGDAGISEFIPNFQPGEYDEDSMEVFRRIVSGINRLREMPTSCRAGGSRPFTLNLKPSDWDTDFVLVLRQVEQAIEQLRAALEDGVPLPSADYLLNFDELGWHDDTVEFLRRVQTALNDLWRRQQPPRARNSQRTLFDLPQTQDESHKEAVSLPTSAADSPPRDESFWQDRVATARDGGQHEQAVELAKQGVRQYPRSDWLWRELGNELARLDRLDEAEEALDTARGLNPNVAWLWRYLAALHRKRKDHEKEIESLETLHGLGVATWLDLNQLGIAYHNHRDLAKAAESYRQSGVATTDATPWVNLGLVFNDPEFSQDVDAADAYRRALARKPDHERAKTLLETTKRKLAPLAHQAQAAATGLVQSDERFEFYLSPFEVLQLEEGAAAEQFDAKAIQRAKKRLLQELDLNDGKVSWLDDYPLDKSRALALEDELHDESKRCYHWAVFQNKHLLDFLTRGDIRHFLYSDDYFPRDTLELLDHEPGFRAFLSRPLARQYNRVLTRAIERRLLPVVEVLFDGRRWVEPTDDDTCFEGASKRVDDLVELMRSKVADGSARKVSLSEMVGFLEQHSFPELFNLLPTHFASYQRDVVAEIRSLAVSCFNEHGDSDLSKGILSLCGRFTSRSAALAKQLEEDREAIEEKISEDRRHSFSALVRPGQAVDVSRTGIRLGNETINSKEVETVRWGIFIRTVNGEEREHSFSLAVGSAHKVLHVEWDMRGLLGNIIGFYCKDNEGVPISLLTRRAQQAHFERMIDAVLYNLVPPLLDRLMEHLQAGRTVVVGPCILTNAGVTFTTGVFFQTHHLLPWQDVDMQRGGGQVSVISRTNRNALASMAAKDTDNAVILPILCAAMCERTSTEESRHGQQVAKYQRSPASFNKRAFVGWMVAPAIIAIIIGVSAFTSTKTTPDAPAKTSPSRRSSAPPVAPSVPAYSPAFAPGTSVSESERVYRVPSYIGAELNRDRQVLYTEKAIAERMARQLESLGREIEQKDLYLDRTSRFAVDEYNCAVDTYNGLLESVRAQKRRVDHLIQSYNDKLRKYGR